MYVYRCVSVISPTYEQNRTETPSLPPSRVLSEVNKTIDKKNEGEVKHERSEEVMLNEC